jgi:hypothetical protein
METVTSERFLTSVEVIWLLNLYNLRIVKEINSVNKNNKVMSNPEHINLCVRFKDALSCTWHVGVGCGSHCFVCYLDSSVETARTVRLSSCLLTIKGRNSKKKPSHSGPFDLLDTNSRGEVR